MAALIAAGQVVGVLAVVGLVSLLVGVVILCALAFPRWLP